MCGKLILVSYRLPMRFTVSRGRLKLTPSSGGLATALHSYIEEQKTSNAFASVHWIGISDLAKRSFDRANSSPCVKVNNMVLHPTFLEARTSDLFYNGFCNAVLWPLFHYFPSFVIYDQQYFHAYEDANQFMKEAVLSLYRPGDVIWVHDYHFMLLPAILRQALPDAQIGFFLHIPFPSFEVFRMLPKPWRIGILRGLMGANVVGFHTKDYILHFKTSLRKMLPKIAAQEHRRVIIREFPISIDFQKFWESAQLQPVKKELRKLGERFGETKVILSVDRLDYTKAIINRLEAYEFFLQQHPEYKKKVTYLLLLVPSRDGVLKYRENKKEVETQISRINGIHGSFTWTPIIYQYRSVDFRKLVALYRIADIALITPARDGMNLVAKEYVAARTDLSGVLILSETAGCSSELKEAILVNPNDRHEIAASLLKALQQSPEEQLRRMKKMQKIIRNNNVYRWASGFMKALTEEPIMSPA